VIAAVVLMPEGLAALRAAHVNRLQTAMNLAPNQAVVGREALIDTVRNGSCGTISGGRALPLSSRHDREVQEGCQDHQMNSALQYCGATSAQRNHRYQQS
jgi:hypothetical protein